jgi:hypothetical protein
MSVRADESSPKSIQDRRQDRIARKPKAAGEKIPKYDNLSVFGNRNLFV